MPMPFVCKKFSNNVWTVLGVVYATNLDVAWELAIKKFGNVDNVWDLYSSD